MSIENEIIAKIESGFGTRRSIVPLYRQALRSFEDIDWSRIHDAIINRWSYFAVEWISREARLREEIKEVH